MTEKNYQLIDLTAKIVSAHASNNNLTEEDYPNLIQQVYRSLLTISETQHYTPLHNQPPAVPIKKSVTPDYIICLEDGKRLQMLKRHLKTMYNLTFEQYREKWCLPPDYPSVCSNYAKKRSEIAKTSGLGRKKSYKKKASLVSALDSSLTPPESSPNHMLNATAAA
jgi:predicted transcriptional regulator